MNLIKNNRLSVILVGIAIALTGCTPKSTEVFPEQDFYTVKSDVAIVWTSDSEHGTFYRDGSQGLLAMAISNVLQGSLPDKLHTIQIDTYTKETYIDKFSEGFSKKGFNVKAIKAPLDKTQFKRLPRSNKRYLHDLSKLKDELGVSYALVLEIKDMGASQDVFGPFTTSEPKGYFHGRLLLVDIDSSELVGEYQNRIKIKTQVHWDNPPDYPEMLQAMEEAFTEFIGTAYLGFFEGDPQK